MERDVEYYNTTYSPIDGVNEFRTYENDDAVESEVQRPETDQAIQNSENVEPDNPTRSRSTRQEEANPSKARPISLVDEDGYSLPSNSEEQSPSNSSNHSEEVSVKKSFGRKVIEWKYSKIFLICVGVLFVATVTALVLVYIIKIPEEKKGRFLVLKSSSLSL